MSACVSFPLVSIFCHFTVRHFFSWWYNSQQLALRDISEYILMTKWKVIVIISCFTVKPLFIIPVLFVIFAIQFTQPAIDYHNYWAWSQQWIMGQRGNPSMLVWISPKIFQEVIIFYKRKSNSLDIHTI